MLEDLEVGINTKVDNKSIITLALAIAIAGVLIVMVSAISRATIKSA